MIIDQYVKILGLSGVKRTENPIMLGQTTSSVDLTCKNQQLLDPNDQNAN